MNGSVFRHEAMATHFEIVVAGAAPDYARQAAAAAFRELDRLETQLSRFVEGSDIARANGLGPGESIAIGSDTLECLLLAAEASVATDGAFDPAYASGRSERAANRPAFTLDPSAHTLTSHAAPLRLDLGAVGKGFALDRMAEILREWDVLTACLNAGGSTVLALEAPSDAAGWPVGLGDGVHARTIPLAAAALSASGTAVKGAHLIDPRTQVAASRPGRVWALAPSAALADALSTAFFVFDEYALAEFCARHAAIGAASSAAEKLRTYGALNAKLDF
jgi:thiamine biosynthesis lipoprotein